jgi:hypothetical protein
MLSISVAVEACSAGDKRRLRRTIGRRSGGVGMRWVGTLARPGCVDVTAKRSWYSLSRAARRCRSVGGRDVCASAASRAAVHVAGVQEATRSVKGRGSASSGVSSGCGLDDSSSRQRRDEATGRDVDARLETHEDVHAQDELVGEAPDDGQLDM